MAKKVQESKIYDRPCYKSFNYRVTSNDDKRAWGRFTTITLDSSTLHFIFHWTSLNLVFSRMYFPSLYFCSLSYALSCGKCEST